MKELSKPFYLGSIFGSFGFGLLLVLIAVIVLAASGNNEPSPVALGMICLMYPLMIYGAVIVAVLIYKIWKAIQDGPARTTPGKAVGFMFIPFFNLYWIFQAYWGWAVDYNRYVREKNVPNAPSVSEGMVLTICILTFVAILPFIGLLVSLVNLVLMSIFFNQAIDGANAIIRHQSGGMVAPTTV